VVRPLRVQTLWYTKGTLVFLLAAILSSCTHASASNVTPSSRVSDLQAPVPDRLAQGTLRFVVDSAMDYFNGAGTFGNASSLEARLSESLPSVTVTRFPADERDEVALAVSADGRSGLFGILSATGRCWYIEANNEPVSTGGPRPSWSLLRGDSYSEVGIDRGKNRECSVAEGPAGTGGNRFSGWEFDSFPKLD